MRRVVGALAVSSVLFGLQLGTARAAGTPDVSVTTSANQAAVPSGDIFGFDVTIANSGATGTTAATGIAVTDTLPLGIPWALTSQSAANDCSLSPAQGSATTQQTVSCAIPTLDAGSSFTFSVRNAVAPEACGTYTNGVSVTVGNETGGPFTASATGKVVCAVVAMTVTADSATVRAGSPVGFTVTIVNNGPDQAVSVHLNMWSSPPLAAPVFNTASAWTKSCTTYVPGPTTSPGPGGAGYLCTIPTLDPGSANAVTARFSAVTPGSSCGTDYTLSADLVMGDAGGAYSGRATSTVTCSTGVQGISTTNGDTGAGVSVPATGGTGSATAPLVEALLLCGLVALTVAGAGVPGDAAEETPLG